jgi:hypothetical protein
MIDPVLAPPPPLGNETQTSRIGNAALPRGAAPHAALQRVATEDLDADVLPDETAGYDEEVSGRRCAVDPYLQLSQR